MFHNDIMPSSSEDKSQYKLEDLLLNLHKIYQLDYPPYNFYKINTII